MHFALAPGVKPDLPVKPGGNERSTGRWLAA